MAAPRGYHLDVNAVMFPTVDNPHCIAGAEWHGWILLNEAEYFEMIGIIQNAPLQELRKYLPQFAGRVVFTRTHRQGEGYVAEFTGEGTVEVARPTVGQPTS